MHILILTSAQMALNASLLELSFLLLHRVVVVFLVREVVLALLAQLVLAVLTATLVLLALL